MEAQKAQCTHPVSSGLRKLLMAAGSSDFKMNKYDDMAETEKRKREMNKHTKKKMTSKSQTQHITECCHKQS